MFKSAGYPGLCDVSTWEDQWSVKPRPLLAHCTLPCTGSSWFGETLLHFHKYLPISLSLLSFGTYLPPPSLDVLNNCFLRICSRGGLISFSFMTYSKLLNLPPTEEIVKVHTVAEFSHLLAFTTFYLGYSRRKNPSEKIKYVLIAVLI